ncbi:MAG: FAD-binding protein [Gammaproteobacteria bacterium]|nr:FAD-binding protein [Gammaproteobacteria bacterium]
MRVDEKQDLVVIGGGLAGLAAACRAAELGLKPLVLEATDDESYLCNSRITGGIFHVAMHDIRLSEDEARKNIHNASQGFARPELVDALAGNAVRSVDWLRSQGIRFIRGGPTPELGTVLAPPRLQQFGMHWKGRGGDVLLRTLSERLAERGGTLRRGARVLSIVMEAGCCTGVEVEIDGSVSRLRTGAVVIADGGFQANQDMVGQYISPAPEKLFQRNAGTGRGDGIRIAAAVGAKLVGMDKFYGHVLHRDVINNERLWPHPMIDSMAVSGVVVNGGGQRVFDEGLGGVSIANMIAKLEDPHGCTVICDAAAWRGPAREAVMGPNPNLEKAGGKVITADSIEDLAAKTGLPATALGDTVRHYNEAVARGTLNSLDPPRTSNRFRPLPIAEVPLLAVPVCAGITYSMGGIAIDGAARALDANDQPIPGLYAAGASTGGLEGGPNTAYTGGLSKAVVFGLLAGEAAARFGGNQPR